MHHRFPTCFVWGTAREDGLRIFAGHVGDGPVIASPWTPDDSLFVWTVFDCRSAYAIESADHRTQIVVLAALTVELPERPRAGERHVVAAWRSRPREPLCSPNPRTSVVLNLAARTVLHRNALAADIETIADPTVASAQPPVRQLLDPEADI